MDIEQRIAQLKAEVEVAESLLLEKVGNLDTLDLFGSNGLSKSSTGEIIKQRFDNFSSQTSLLPISLFKYNKYFKLVYKLYSTFR